MKLTTAKLIEAKEFKGESFPIYYIKATLNQNIDFGVQPSVVTFLTDTFNIGTKIGENFKLEGLNGMFQLESSYENPWEFLGSDHNSGTLFYGEKSNVEMIMPNILGEIAKDVHTYNKPSLEEGGGVNTVQWDFPDGNSMIIMYADDECFSLDKSKFKNIVIMPFGGQVDDICAQEIMASYVNFAIKGIAPNLSEDDEEYLSDYFEECITVNNKFPSKKYQDLVLDAGYKLFCEILSGIQLRLLIMNLWKKLQRS